MSRYRGHVAEQEERPPFSLSERFDEALVYASRVHGGQVRKGTSVPYVAHVLGVASLVLEDGGDEDQAIAALLHDAAEDQGGRERLEDIRRRFGDRVAGIVDACTDTYETPKPPWRVRKEGYVEHLRREEDVGALRVSLADKLHNARAIVLDYREIGEALWARFNRGRDDQLWYYRSLLGVFAERCPGPMFDELRRTVEELDRLCRT